MALLVVRPDHRFLGEAAETFDPIADHISSLLQQNATLTSLRDMLLPKLVTGKIDVSNLDLDRLIEEAAV